MTKLISDFHKLWERLIELSNKAIPDVSKIILNINFFIMIFYNIIYIFYNILIGDYEYYNKSLVSESSSFTFK